ncbi:hypothetical protein KIN20_008750 [Parelaphostrongylus tenuis]|uniref:Uncharacterized protein n=1 Tax=Parelaphostrongylus tenuis TaxID=148309 RepID=A0AAD5QKS4_PARTN|nr:hypothetical protein KIN20_008750 [Parelaphostrongylus tenuis]
MEKIVKLQKYEISATEDGDESGKYRDPIRRQSSSSMISTHLSCDDPKTFARNSSLSSASSVNTEGSHIVLTSDVQLSKNSLWQRYKTLKNGPDQDLQQRWGIQPQCFVIESFSSSSEDSHPDWKAPLPPSMYLRKNRPELIRRIENRQAAIRAATILRQRVTKEKMVFFSSSTPVHCTHM